MLAWNDQARSRRDQDLDDEIGHDLALEIEERIRSGLSREEAERSARREFGNFLIIKETIRETWGWTWIERLVQDLRFAARTMRRDPGFTLAAVLSLALGIGSATALFSVEYALLIAPPHGSYGDSKGIWDLELRSVADPDEWVALRVAQYLEIKRLSSFSDVIAVSADRRLLTGKRSAGSVHASLVSGNAFQFVGARPVIGRVILPADDDPAGHAPPVVLLSYEAWQRWFNGRRNALGQMLVLDDRPHKVIGVMPQRFDWWAGDVWLPLAATRPVFISVSMRLRAGVSTKTAGQQLHELFESLARKAPRNYPKAGCAIRLLSYDEQSVAEGVRYALRWLIVVVGFLLLIACANAANLQLARLSVRSREIAVRMALGAGRSRLLRQFLTESVALALAGGVLGALLSLALVRATAALVPVYGGRLAGTTIAVNGYVLLFSMAVTLLTGILCGLAPAVQCSRPGLVAALADASGTGVTGVRMRNRLVCAEVALSVCLLFGAIITLRAFLMAQNLNRGFQPVRVLAASLPLSRERYPTYESRMAFTENVLARLRNLPGVQSAAMANNGLFHFGSLQSGLAIQGLPVAQVWRCSLGLISADYVRTMGIPLRAGRDFTGQEVASASHVALINQLASRLWPAGQSPIGARIRLDILAKPDESLLAPAGSGPDVTIVGVLARTKSSVELGATAAPLVLIPCSLLAPPSRRLFVRTEGDPMLLWNAVRQQIRAIDENQPVVRPHPVEDSLALGTENYRFDMALFGFVGAMGLILAAAGIYSVLTYTVAIRTHEIGVRLALGASPRSLVSLVLSMGAKLFLIGLAIGLTGSVVLLRFVDISSVPKTDLLAVTVVITLLAAAAFAACYRPARRAAQIDPMVALHHE